MTELLSAFNKQTKQRWGVHEVLALIFQDNKQRFLVAGSEDDPRAEYYRQPVYPLWVRAAHGHSVNLDLDDRDIAVRWFTLVPRDQGPLAPYKGRPCAAIEDVPPRLYHRTVEDAAFQILDGELTPGFGDSGKLHNYFSSLPLEEMTNQAGVRKDLPIEIVFETSAVLRYAYLFETASDGVLCREKVPGSTIRISEIPPRTKFSTHVRWRRQHLEPQHQWMTLAPRKWWPSPKALRQVQTWQSSPRSHVQGLPRCIWSFRAPSARTAVELASSTTANAPSHCGI